MPDGAEPDAGHPTTAEPTTARAAVVVSFTEDLLNGLLALVVGEGVPLDPLEQQVVLPAMGEVDLRLALTITGGSLDLRAEDGGRARAVVTADGDVSVRTADYEGDVVEGAPLGLPELPAPIPVRVEALVDPMVELRDDRTVNVGLDLSRAELVSLQVDPDAPVPDGVDPGTWVPMTQMVQVMFGSMGDGLFASLGEHVGSVGTDLGPDVGMVLHELGVATGRATVGVGTGTLTFSLPARPDAEGVARPVPVAGNRLGVGAAAGAVDHLAHLLLERAIGNLPLPFELELDLGEQRVGGTLRQSRVLSDRLPDLRSALRTEIRPRLVGGRLELTVQAAWVELPSFLPGFVNDLSRTVGGLAGAVPLRLRFPATVALPLVPGSTDTVPVRVDDLRVTAEGVGVVLALD